MCGIAGFFEKIQGDAPQKVLEQMLRRIQHRGPDDQGMWHEDGIYLGHRRLSILDLSPAGHQPMQSRSERFVMVFNGEIYNHQSIRKQLESQYEYQWRGHSDTEVMLAAIESWGVAEAISTFNGMFAFALWDRKQRELVLARDRLGEKPLYYTQQNGKFIFGSELKCLEVNPDFRRDIDPQALGEFFKYNNVPAPLTIYRNTYKLLPAHYLIWSAQHNTLQQHCYWDLRRIAQETQQPERLASATEPELIDQLDGLLSDAVRLRMEADVPLGAFLSGGIDSSMVVALMQKQSNRPVKTFSIGFDIPGYNEAEHAKAVAQHLGTEHTEQYVTGQEAMSVVPKLGEMYDEPFADSSQIPTYLVSGIARKSVTVCLSGDGGDELFGGYSRYQVMPVIWNKIDRVPLRQPVAGLIAALPDSVLRVMVVMLSRLARAYLRNPLTTAKLRQILPLLSAKNQMVLYQTSLQNWKQPEHLVKGYVVPKKIDLVDDFDFKDFLHVMMLQDSLNYLPNDILTKVDRATMAVSLEGRIPLLDHRVAEFAWSLPASLKFREKQGKWILRQLLYRYVPRELIDRPKMGFGVPLSDWLRRDLRDWAASLLDPSLLKQQGLLDPEIIQQQWQAHQSGKGDYSNQLWPVLMLQAWHHSR